MLQYRPVCRGENLLNERNDNHQFCEHDYNLIHFRIHYIKVPQELRLSKEKRPAYLPLYITHLRTFSLPAW